jgi:predicted small lipoprotein YifL
MRHLHIISLLTVLSSCGDKCNLILPPLELTPSPVTMRVGDRRSVDARRATCGGGLARVNLAWTVDDTTVAVVDATSGELVARAAGVTVLRGLDVQLAQSAIDTVRVLP